MLMSLQPQNTPRQIIWPSVITVISAAILIGAEVFGAAFAAIGAVALLILVPANWTAQRSRDSVS